MALTATVYFMFVLTTCSTKECILQLEEKTKGRFLVLANVNIRNCHVDCVGEEFIFARCFQLRESRQTGMPGRISQENQHNVLKPSCGSKVCNTTSVCLGKGCSNVCVQAPSFCDLHMASKTGDLAKVKVILSQGRADKNCKEWNGRTPVMLAAGEGHRDVVQLLVSNGANVSVVDDFCINILHSACQGGDVVLVKYVLSLGKHDINKKVLCGGTPVMLAAESGHRKVVELLAGQGANVSLHDNIGNTILHFACRGGEVEVVKYVLSQDMADTNSRGWKSMIPVMMAAEKGHRDVVELLVRNGANLSLKDVHGNTILHIVCHGGDVEVVKYFLSKKMVDINSRGWKSMTPVMSAAEKGHKDMVELLVRNGANVLLKGKHRTNILHYACVGGHVEVVKYVLSQNMVKIHTRDSKGLTPLMMAATEGHRGVVELLVREGANVSPNGKYKSNILHFASRGGDVETVKYVLSENMVDINSRNRKGMTPMFMAAEKGNKEVVELFFRRGADMSLVSRSGKNILHFACRGGNMDLVRFVLSQKKTDIDIKDGVYFTPLLTAAARGHKEVVELLVSEGAKVSVVDARGNDILHLACRGGHVEMVKYVLSQNMVDINNRNKEGMTSAMIAAGEGHQEVVDLLLSKGADRSFKDNN